MIRKPTCSPQLQCSKQAKNNTIMMLKLPRDRGHHHVDELLPPGHLFHLQSVFPLILKQTLEFQPAK